MCVCVFFMLESVQGKRIEKIQGLIDWAVEELPWGVLEMTPTKLDKMIRHEAITRFWCNETTARVYAQIAYTKAYSIRAANARGKLA